MNPTTEQEQELLTLLEEIYNDGKRIQLQLHPDEEKTISRKPVNKCRVESSYIDGRYKYFSKISEHFYDLAVEKFYDKYHPKFKVI